MSTFHTYSDPGFWRKSRKNILLFVSFAKAHSLEQKHQNMTYKFGTTRNPGDPTSLYPNLIGADDYSVPGSPQWCEQ